MAAEGVLIELHKFWFCHDDLMHCVGGTNMKYAFDRPTLPSLWLVQVGTYFIQIEVVALEEVVVTLALGLRPRQRLAKVRAKREAQESHLMFSRMQESVRDWTSTFPSELSFWELEFQWIHEFLESNFKGLNSLDWKVPYIMGKLLELRCIKWVRMTHLGT